MMGQHPCPLNGTQLFSFLHTFSPKSAQIGGLHPPMGGRLPAQQDILGPPLVNMTPMNRICRDLTNRALWSLFVMQNLPPNRRSVMTLKLTQHNHYEVTVV